MTEIDEENGKRIVLHFARRKERWNRFVSRSSRFMLKAVIGKMEYGFVFRFPWYRTEWGKQIHSIYTDHSLFASASWTVLGDALTDSAAFDIGRIMALDSVISSGLYILYTTRCHTNYKHVINIQGGPKNGLFLRSDNFATTNDTKASSEVS